MKNILTIIIFLFLIISCDSTSNSTSCGQFWFSEFKNKEADPYVLFDGYYVNIFNYKGQFCLHLIRSLHMDDYSEYKGIAILRNDTLFIDIVNNDKFTFETILERKNLSKPYNIYYTCSKSPKKIFWNDKEIVPSPPFVIKL